MFKTWSERLSDDKDFKTPIFLIDDCSHCRREMQEVIRIEDCTGQLQSVCLTCVAHLIESISND